MGNGSGPDACLVRIHGSLDADNHGADDAAAHAFRREGFNDDADARRRYLLRVQTENDGPGCEVDARHQGDDRLGDRPDPAHAGDGDEPHHEGHDHPERQAVLKARGLGKLREGLIHLEERETPHDAARGKDGSQTSAGP